MKIQISVVLLCLVFHCFGSEVSSEGSCSKEFEAFTEKKQEIEILSYSSRVDFDSYFDEVEVVLSNIEKKLEEIQNQIFLKRISKYRDFLKKKYLKHIYHNSVQHGSLAFEKGRDSNNATSFIKTSVFLTKLGIRIEVRNDRIKSFPRLIKKRFFRGDEVPRLYDRTGFRGNGVAHIMLIEGLDKLSKKSYIEWVDEGESIAVKVFLNLSKKRDLFLRK